jgi:menaquinol-cytochrome c reductase iron-sulfur subunit
MASEPSHGTPPTSSRGDGTPPTSSPVGSRRSFLGMLSVAGSAVIGLIVAVPGASYVIDPLLRSAGKKGRWVRLGDLTSYSEDHPVVVPIEGEQVDAWTRSDKVRLGMVWIRKKGDKVVALNAECPHLGCKVGYVKDQKKFACPCHDSSFTEEGERVGGPAPRSMDPLESRIVDGKVEVCFVRYRAQVKERVEVG